MVEQQAAEGTVLAPIAGRVLDVPVAVGAVVLPGEVVATLGGGGIFLRLAVPERHASALAEGDSILIERPEGEQQGTLERIYPLIENGRVMADVAVEGLPDAFVDARVLVRLPVGDARGAGGAGGRRDHPRGAGFRRRLGRRGHRPARRRVWASAI